MGYDIDQFSSDVNDELVCSICTNVLMEPVQTQCDHLFCHACLHHWLRTSPSCPVDRHYLCNDMIKPAPRYIRNLINQLLIQCDYRSDGCKAEIMLEGYEQHVDNCVFNPNRVVTCKHAHCRKQMTVNQLNRHDCISELVHRNKELTAEVEVSHRIMNRMAITLMVMVVLYICLPLSLVLQVLFDLATFFMQQVPLPVFSTFFVWIGGGGEQEDGTLPFWAKS